MVVNRARRREARTRTSARSCVPRTATPGRRRESHARTRSPRTSGRSVRASRPRPLLIPHEVTRRELRPVRRLAERRRACNRRGEAGGPTSRRVTRVREGRSPEPRLPPWAPHLQREASAPRLQPMPRVLSRREAAPSRQARPRKPLVASEQVLRPRALAPRAVVPRSPPARRAHPPRRNLSPPPGRAARSLRPLPRRASPSTSPWPRARRSSSARTSPCRPRRSRTLASRRLRPRPPVLLLEPVVVAAREWT